MSTPALVYLLCFATCATCASLLVRSWSKTRMRLMMWTAISFVLFAVNNLFLFLDVIVFPESDLFLFRYVPALAGVMVMIVGFIWESE